MQEKKKNTKETFLRSCAAKWKFQNMWPEPLTLLISRAVCTWPGCEIRAWSGKRINKKQDLTHLHKIYAPRQGEQEQQQGSRARELCKLSPPSQPVQPGMKADANEAAASRCFFWCGWYRSMTWVYEHQLGCSLVSWGHSAIRDSQAYTSKPSTSLHSWTTVYCLTPMCVPVDYKQMKEANKVVEKTSLKTRGG